MNIGDRTMSLAGYRYGFNGKEKDPSVEWGSQAIYDYGFRIYNPGLGKFLSVDPLAPDYPELTTYQFASNTPIQAIDLDGLEALTVHSAFWTSELLEEDLSKLSSEEIIEKVTSYNNSYNGGHGGFKDQSSLQHASTHYESTGTVTTIDNPTGPLRLTG